MKVEITLTWSKLIAGIILILSFTLDLIGSREGIVFMFSLPIVAGLIAGKQINDRLKK